MINPDKQENTPKEEFNARPKLVSTPPEIQVKFERPGPIVPISPILFPLIRKPKAYVPTIDDLVNFTAAYETYREKPYFLNEEGSTNKQKLAGYGSADPNVIKLAEQGKLTEEIAREELKKHLKYNYDQLEKNIPNWNDLSENVKLALTETAYNCGLNVILNKSPKLMQMINSGTTDPKELVKQMDHSKTAGGWLGVRSAARRAMALGEYDWKWNVKDKYGRHLQEGVTPGVQDYLAGKYREYKQGGVLKRVK